MADKVLQPTDEQRAIVEAGRDSDANLMIHAYAGTGKTTTLTMLSQVLPIGLALAFNVKIKDELKKKFSPGWDVLTANGLGHRAVGSALGKNLILDDRKIGKLVTQVMKEQRYDGDREDWATIRGLVESAMQVGLVPRQTGREGPTPDTAEDWLSLGGGLAEEAQIAIAQRVLLRSIEMGLDGIVCFADQIYLSALFDGKFQQYPVVVVDESQDLSPLNHMQIAKTLGPTSRLVAVGDEKQAIYAWRGADAESMQNLRTLRTKWLDLPLATTFRCPKTSVARVQKHAPGFKAAETNAEGEELYLLGMPWSLDAQQGITYKVGEEKKVFSIAGKSFAIICRNNAPLVKMAFKLIRKNVGVVMLGRDIGRGLQTLSQKLFSDDAMPIEQCYVRLSEWQDSQLALAAANNDDSLADSISDKAGCLFAVIDAAEVKDAGALRRALAQLFDRDSAQITLSSGHRAKGLEWDTVLHLDPQLIPSKWSKSPEAREQEDNLRYVIETRNKQTYILAKLKDFE